MATESPSPGYERRRKQESLPVSSQPMNITLREDLDPDTDFYYACQFEIYHEPYLIWDRDFWQEILTSCAVYRIEVDGKYAGDVLLEGRGKDRKYIVDFSILPQYQGRGIGKAVLKEMKKMDHKLTGVTRKETLDFFLKSGFVLKKTLKNYYRSGVDGYYVEDSMGHESGTIGILE